VINHFHPGSLDTDMTGQGISHFLTTMFSMSQQALTVLIWLPYRFLRGADSGVFAALLPPGTVVRGEYIWHDCQVVDWVNGPMPSVS